jgi:Na+-translocating ferredoxin:NAD+ oxidoreductase RnfA subunit
MIRINIKILSYILIITGISVWIPFLYLKLKNREPYYLPYLSINIPLIFTGMAMMIVFVMRKNNEKKLVNF